jgi:hypothetical protein
MTSPFAQLTESRVHVACQVFLIVLSAANSMSLLELTVPSETWSEILREDVYATPDFTVTAVKQTSLWL